MASRELTFDLPEEIVALVGSPDVVAAKARLALLMELLKEGVISQGQVAEILGITRADILHLLGEHGIPSGPESGEDMRREIADARRALHLR